MAQFPNTHWSLIVRSGADESQRRQAFGELVRDYRPAILAYFRTRLGADAAEDATQSFLSASYEHAWWSRAESANGSFRAFLLLLLRRHLGHVQEAVANRKEDPDLTVEIADTCPGAEQRFDARFALALTARALDGLREHYAQRGRAALFDALVILIGTPPEHGELGQVAARLQMAPNTLTVECRRLRERLRAGLRHELQMLCADAATFASEWQTMEHILDAAG